MKSKIVLYCLCLTLLSSCVKVVDHQEKPITHDKQIGTKVYERPTANYNGKIPAVWKNLAARLKDSGFKENEIKAFFNSPDLKFSHRPMEIKLRELHGIFYKSERTKAIQENLYQLGYDINIDGRMGSGTRNAIIAYQKANGLAQSGLASDELLKNITQKLNREGAKRSLASYSQPAPKKPSKASTYKQFTNPEALAKISAYYKADKALFNKMEKELNVPGSLVAAIMWVETGYGSYFGKNKAGTMLASMAASMDFDLVSSTVSDLGTDRETLAWMRETSKKRGEWAYKELVALLKYANTNNLDANKLPGSIYGAIGYGQFMPSNIATYGLDGDNDNQIDLFNKIDAIYSIAYYLKKHGWNEPMTNEEAKRKVIMSYNKSGIYVNTVLFVENWLKNQ